MHSANIVSTIAAVIFQMVALDKSLHTPDLSYEWLPAVAMIIAQGLGIITACVPYLKAFMDNIESGMIRSDDLLRHREVSGTRVRGNGYANELGPVSPVTTQNKPARKGSLAETPQELAIESSISSGPTGKKGEAPQSWETGSDSSGARIIEYSRA